MPLASILSSRRQVPWVQAPAAKAVRAGNGSAMTREFGCTLRRPAPCASTTRWWSHQWKFPYSPASAAGSACDLQEQTMTRRRRLLVSVAVLVLLAAVGLASVRLLTGPRQNITA